MATTLNARRVQVLFALCLALLTVAAMVAALGALGDGPPAVQAGQDGGNAGTVTETLMALYDSTDGPNWTNNEGWGSSDPYCTAWYGVSCFGGVVTSIDLDGNNLSGTIPSELGNLGSLQELWLYNNNLSGPIPSELGNLAGLEGLYLDNNQLSGSIPPELGNLSNLLALYLWENNLSGPIPSELGNLGSLQLLSLHHNNLSGPIPSELGNLGSLQLLNLYYNNLSGPIPSELGNLSSLWFLTLSGNPRLICWQTEAALDWALQLGIYSGPTAICSFSCLPLVMR